MFDPMFDPPPPRAPHAPLQAAMNIALNTNIHVNTHIHINIHMHININK